MSLRLVHIHLPDGTVSAPMPMGRVLEMLEAKEITLDTQICDRGTDDWTLLRYEDAVMRPTTHLATSGTMAERHQSAPTSEPGDGIGERLQKAALIFVAIGLLFGVVAGMAFGSGGFIVGASTFWTLALIVGVFALVMKRREV
ncbi:MAG: hypothetical protein V4662_11835 [Verrucomicrobiota bacterium]